MPTTEASCRPSTYSISSGQSLRNGNSVEPGLPNTFLIPNARRRPKVASLTVVGLLSVLVGLRDKSDLKFNPSFRGDAQHRTTMCNCTSENLEIPRCANCASVVWCWRTIPE